MDVLGRGAETMQFQVNFAHLHLLLNHIPIIGTIIAFCLFLISFFGKNDDLRRSSFIIFAGVALLTIPTFVSGFGAQSNITGQSGVARALIERHEGAAMLSFWFMEITGALAIVGLWQFHRTSRPARWNVLAVLFFSVVTVGLMARSGNTGGDIRHPEVGAGREAPVTEGTVGSILRVFEPTPDKFIHAMVLSKWETAFLMDLHFIGLALIVGTVGALDLRILGFAKQLPIAPLHKFVPWALAGLGLNVTTGMLVLIGMPVYYTFDAALWLKILALMLLGLNAAAFYLTDTFSGVEHVKAGEDAAMSAKLVAASSMCLWLAVIILGRYIQSFQDTIN
jgi:uncharacterized membrane protein